jgi:hypothetical protein
MLVVIDNTKLAGYEITLNGGCTQGDGQFFFKNKKGEKLHAYPLFLFENNFTRY